MCIAYRPTFDVQTTSNFDVSTTRVDRRCIDVVYMLSEVATLSLPRRNDVGVPPGKSWIDISVIMLYILKFGYQVISSGRMVISASIYNA